MTSPAPPDPSSLDATRIAPISSGPSAGGAAVKSGADAALTSIGGYHLIRRIGSGGMGSIYLAVQSSVGRQVAVKVLAAELFDNPLAVERFEREVKVLGQLSHPNICPVLEAGLEGRTYFYVMEHLKGLDVSKVLRTQRVDARRAATVAVQVARALQYAHERGIVHRDVKPLNIMLLRGDRLRGDAGTKPAPLVAAPADDGLPSPEWVDKAVLIDFGLARDTASASALTMSGAVIGTPAYMAPEQARGDRHAVGAATDVWSLGVTLYEMLSLRTPFEGETVGAILQSILNDDPAPLRRIAPDVDPDLETIVQHAMEKEPARRYASAGAMADDLERWLAGEPVHARRASLGYRIRKRVSRNKLASAAIAAAALLAAAGLWMAFAPGEIVLGGDLAGASVTVNGHSRSGPVLRIWPPGSVRVEVAREGCQTFVQQLEVKARSSVPVAVTTPSLFGSLRIESMPAGAEAWCGGALLGRTPCVARLGVGLAEVTLRAPRHEDHAEKVEVKSGIEQPLRAALVHQAGRLSISSEPAELGLDLVHTETGEALFTAAPALHVPLKTGRWKGIAHAENRWRRAVDFEIRTGEETDVGITLPEMVIWKHTSDAMHVNWAAGDVNGDRYPDILVANGKPARLRALDGRTGRLLWIREGLPDSAALFRPIAVDIADLDGDLRPEVVFGGGGEIAVLEGASGKLRSAWPLADCIGATSHGDLDGDGGTDILAWSLTGIGALRGHDGKRLWWTATQGTPWPMPARLNADASPDVILHDTGRVVGVDGRDGRSLWVFKPGPANYHFTADLNADGFDDAWVVTPGGEAIFHAISGVDGTDLWTFRETNPITAQPTGGAADLDSDGKLEIVQQREESLHVFSCATQGPVKVLPITASWPRPVFLDLTGDGRPEILIPSGSSVLGIDPATWAVAWRFDLDSKCASTPLLADFDGDGRQDIAVQSEAGVVYVVSAFESPLLWRHGDPHYWTEQPAPDGDPARTLLVPGTPTRLLNASDGRSLAEWSIPGHFRAVPARRDGALRFAIEGQGMAMVDPGEKKELWKQMRYRGWTRPLATDLNADGTDDIVWGGDQKDSASILEAFDGRDGATLWKQKFARQPGAALAAAGGTIWVPGRDGRVHALAPLTGGESAAIDARGALCSVAAVGDDAVFGTMKGCVARIRKAADGRLEIAWSQDLGISLHSHSPVIAGGFVGLSGLDGTVALLDARDGALLWRRTLDLVAAGPPALRDLDGDGRPEVAVAGTDGLVTVLRGADGSRAWAWNLRATVLVTVPVWCDLSGDNRPELLVVTRDARVHALTVDLAPRPVVHWSRPWQRSPAHASGPGRDESARVRARDAWRDGAWAEALAAGREGSSAEAAWYAAMAASRLGDREALLKHAAEARARGCRRLDLAVLAAAELPAAEVPAALEAAFAVASLPDLRAQEPPAALLDAWTEVAAGARKSAEAARDWERAIALAAYGEEWTEVLDCALNAEREGADPGLILLARARAWLRLDRIKEAAADLREAARHGSAVQEARDEWRALELQTASDAIDAARAFSAGDGPRAVRLATRAAFFSSDDPERWNALAWYLATAKGATREDGWRAVEYAQRAAEIVRSSGVTSSLAGILDTLAAAWATAGEFAKAAEAQREALTLPLADAERADFEKRLKEYEREAEKR